MKIHPFIHCHDTEVISPQLNCLFENVSIVREPHYAKRLIKSIEMFDGDVFFQVYGNVEFADWERLIAAAKDAFAKRNCGIYTPNIQQTSLVNTEIKTVAFDDQNLKMVRNTDGIVWFVHRAIIQKLKAIDFSFSEFGWGVPSLACAYSYMLNKPVIQDNNFSIVRPQEIVDSTQAKQEMDELFNRCDNDTKHMLYYMLFQKQQFDSIVEIK